MSCREAMAAVVGVVERGGAIPEEQREHLKHCARCRELLESANQFESAVHEQPVADPVIDEQRLSDEVRGVRRRDAFRRAGVAVTIAIAIPAAIAVGLGLFGDFGWQEIAGIVGIVTVIIAVPLLLFFLMLAVLRDKSGNRICKRLKPGRQVSGVCLGLAEATGISPVLFRLAFFVLAFVNGIGVWLYILLDLAMPVHPDDRQYLLRFRLRRAWQRRFADGEHSAG